MLVRGRVHAGGREGGRRIYLGPYGPGPPAASERAPENHNLTKFRASGS
jgi:hypothetical protein